MSAVDQLRDEEVIALAAYILVYRRSWKINLQSAWESGRYGLSRDADQIPVLQRIRNTLGPSGLQKIKTRDIAAARREIDHNRATLRVRERP